MPDIRAITFDVGGTLIQPRPSVGHVYATVAAEHGITSLSPDELNRRFISAWTTRGCRAETRQDWARIVHQTFEGVNSAADPEALFEALYTRFTEPQSWHVFEEVVPTLQALQRRGVSMGVLSNWDDRLRPLLARLELAGFFDVIIVSCEVGCRKPDPEIFTHATQAFGLAPGQMLHVGDSPQHDVQGATDAGMRAVGVRRNPQSTDSDWITGLDQVLNWL